MNDRRFTEQELHTRLGQVKSGIEKLEFEAAAHEAAHGSSLAAAMSPLRSRLSFAEAEFARLQAAEPDMWDEIRANLQSTLDALANDIDGKAPSFDDT